MSEFEIITGNNLNEEIYLQTWELDNKTFEKKDKITKKQALEWFYASEKSTIVLWNKKNNELVGYITPFLLKHSFSSKYIISDINYKEAIDKSTFSSKTKGVHGDIYLFSTVIKEKYRDIEIQNGKTAMKILTEALVDWICEVLLNGVKINYIYADKVSEDGGKYLYSLGLKKCFITKNDEKYAKEFTPEMFDKCDNINRLKDIYYKQNKSKFDSSILNNHEYLSTKNGCLYYKDINLYDLVKEYRAPLEVAYTPIITERINNLKDIFKDKIKKYDYKSKYLYAYATKANYYSEVVLTALSSADMLETSSAYDISIIKKLVDLKIIKPGFRVICNGFKNKKYINIIKSLLKEKIEVIPIIENETEFDLLSKIKEYNINVGIRYNSDFEARLIKNDFKSEDEFDNRFGFNEKEIMQIADKISKTDNLSLKVLHFHFGGTITNIDNYVKGFGNIFELYCKLKKKYNTLKYFDFGGGLPVKYSLDYSFDYDHLIDEMIKTAKELSTKNKIDEPILIGEHGRYTVADHSFYIYKIDFNKLNNGTNWYIINGSLMNMTPDMWGINQDFTILPINLLNNPTSEVILGGETCDPDDRYFLKEKNVKTRMPIIKKGENLYIGIFSVGAYQEIISGIGGVHHCMIPEGNELIIFKDKNDRINYYKAGTIQTTDKMLKILDYDKKDYIDLIWNNLE